MLVTEDFWRRLQGSRLDFVKTALSVTVQPQHQKAGDICSGCRVTYKYQNFKTTVPGQGEARGTSSNCPDRNHPPQDHMLNRKDLGFHPCISLGRRTGKSITPDFSLDPQNYTLLPTAFSYPKAEYSNWWNKVIVPPLSDCTDRKGTVTHILSFL